LPAIALNKIKESLSIEWIYNSNSIEGSFMSLRETNGASRRNNHQGKIITRTF
jgi:hypothetical protein